jgi:hypothetical protein
MISMLHSFDEEASYFRQAVDAFRQVRLRHTAALQRGELQNIWQWQEERNNVFRKLQKALDRLVGILRVSNRPDRDEELKGYVRAVSELMEEETVLRSAVQSQRGEVRRRLQKMRCGKRSLLAYRSAVSGNARPRFLNSKS